MADVTLDLAALDPGTRYKLLTGTVVPRPIAWVTTRNADGSANAAPYSFFNVMSATPPVLVLGIVPRPTQSGFAPKDTAANIAERRDFVVNLVDEDHAEAMNLTSLDAPSGTDEAALAGLELVDAMDVAAPRIASAPVAFECRLRETVDLGEVEGDAQGDAQGDAKGGVRRAIVVADVLRIHARDGVLDPDTLRIDPDAYKPLGRLFGPLYTRQNDRFRMDRPVYSEWVRRQQDGE